jgi:hypothetical protein
MPKSIDDILDQELAAPVTDTTAQVDPNEIYTYLTAKGVPESHAVGMIANIKHESDFIPGQHEKNVSIGGVGLFQHTGSRREALKQAVPDWQSNWRGQIDFALSEPETQKYLQNEFTTPQEATKWFTKNWERPKYAAREAVKRAANIPAISGASSVDEILDAAGIPPVDPAQQALLGSPVPQETPPSAQESMGKQLLRGTAGALPMAGTLFGGALGTVAAGPFGGLGGAALLGSGGKGLENIINTYLLGAAPKTVGEQATSMAQGGLESAAAQAGGDVIGKALGLGIKGAGKVTGFIGEQGTKVAQGLKIKSDAAKYIIDELGPALSQDALATKNLANAQKIESTLQNTLNTADEAGIKINLGDKVIKSDITKLANRKAKAGLRDEAEELFDISRTLSKGREIPVSQANKLKRIFWREAKFKVSGDPGTADAAKASYDKGNFLKTEIEKATSNTKVGGDVKKLNQRMAKSMEVRDAIEASQNKKLTSPTNIGKGGLALTSLLTGNPWLAALAGLGTTPGSSAVGAAGKAMTEVPPWLTKILGVALTPNSVKNPKEP